MARDYRWPKVHGNLLILGFSLLRTTRTGIIEVLQIGAFDGQESDLLEEILGNENVSAILVKPQRSAYEFLVSRYGANPRIRLVNAAVAETDGSATLYVPSSGASPQASLLANHHRRFGLDDTVVRATKVSTVSAASLMKGFQTKHLHILQIDTEGMDYRILKWFFDADIEPDVLNFESVHLSRAERVASRELLNTRGYWWIDSDQDTFAIKQSLARGNDL